MAEQEFKSESGHFFHPICLFALKLTILVLGHSDWDMHKAEQATFIIGTCVGVFLRLT